MIELTYTLIGIIFGGALVWIIIAKPLREKLTQELTSFANMTNENAVLKERMSNLEQKATSDLANEKRVNQDKLKMLEQNKEQMKLEFKELADNILKSNSKEFSTQNQESLTKMITPMKEQFNEFKKQIDDVYIKEAKDRSALQAEIKSIKEINHQMSADAKNLTNALKGESKKQGVWGEMILERVLENSGLRLGEEYDREVSLEHESDGSRYRPDVVVHLPDTREIIIDAKTSLTAYEQYTTAEDEEQKENFASLHVASMKKHVKELSEKDYTSLKGLETLDFVFMFVPVESALLMALEYDNTLFDHAFKKNVIIVGPTTLMVSLRAVENSWKYEHQQKNALDIAKRAGLLFDKFVGFVESVEKLGKQLGTAQKTYDDIHSKMTSGAGSVTSQFDKLKKLGAAASKKLPEHIQRRLEE
ncbi:DNA recombination protein RmuC [Sulfurimonas sp.]|nr:DNA recombination protein RmuC [Sulfurimonas sp.]